jgi:uncharacterized Zn finger protein
MKKTKDEDRDWWRSRPESTGPREARGGIKAHSRRGAFGQSWWARRWLAVLESLELGGRLARGRSYARRGQVLDIQVSEGSVTASVQGSRKEPYAVTIGVGTLSAAAWRKVGRSLGREARFAAKLLASEMPEDVEQAFMRAGVSLFPARRDELATECSCPDWSNPCKHIAAVYYLLGEEFDRDPFLIFSLRGLSRDGLARLLASTPPVSGPEDGEDHAASPPVMPVPTALPCDATAFWSGGAPPEAGEVAIPDAPAAVLARLGPFPFWRGTAPIEAVLGPAYSRASAVALEVYLGQGFRTKRGSRASQY